MKDQSKIISLIGMTGCGKTSVGKILAKKLGADFIDLDDEIVKKYGDVKSIFAERGEAGFRELEFETLREVLSSADKLTLLSCGGGVPTYRPSRELLAAQTLVIWLRRGVDSISSDSAILTRPPLNGSIENYKKLLTERYPVYRGIADYSFYNSFPQRTAAAIVKKLGSGDARDAKDARFSKEKLCKRI